MPLRKSVRSTLDLFLLALINEGVSSYYDFQQQAGLSAGATTPAVTRLLNQGLITASSGGFRRKVTYRLTAAGRNAIETGLDDLIEATVNRHAVDLESILRLVAMAGALQKHGVAELISRAIHNRNVRIAEISPNLSFTSTVSLPASSATGAKYRRLLLQLEQARLRSEIRVLKQIQ